MSPAVTVVDYGIGNLHSVVKAFRYLGAEVRVTSDPSDVPAADRLVLPGVGAFADGIRGLEARGLCEPIVAYPASGRPFLGICLGMQLLLSESDEFGHHRGLGIVPGRVEAIPRDPGLKVPQIGWNRVCPRPGASWEGTLLDSLVPGTMVYFVHSFAAVPHGEEHRLADANYGGHRICAAVKHENVSGCQFHPEKSGAAGLTILSRFLAA